MSESNCSIKKAASNSLSLLNWLNFEFKNTDLSYLQLGEVDLSFNEYNNVNFSNTSMERINTIKSNFINC